MPKEVRCIILDEGDYRVAMSGFLKGRGRDIAPGEIENIEFLQTVGGPSARLIFQARRNEPTMTLDSLDLLGAALLFCGSQDIILPSLGSKTIEISGRSLILVITTSLADSKGAPTTIRVGEDNSAHRIAMGLISAGAAT